MVGSCMTGWGRRRRGLVTTRMGKSSRGGGGGGDWWTYPGDAATGLRYADQRYYESDFAKIGINIHDPHNGAWWTVRPHLQNIYGYNKAWDDWFAANDALIRSNPTAAAASAFDFARGLAKQL